MNQHLKSLWLAETVRLIEKEQGRFDDNDANRLAKFEDNSLSDKIVRRAEIISEQNGLKQAQTNWLNSAKLSILILFILAILMGAGLGFSALANNPVNLYWALLCILGIHFVTLFLWLISCIFIPNESGSLFIQTWLWLAKKIYKKNTVSQIVPAFIQLFSKQIRWLIGLIVNLLWSVILFSCLIILVILLSTKSYSFEWQTTLLNADSVIAITHFLGLLPSALGFSIPDTEMIRVSSHAMSDADIRSAWAIWVLGIFIVYGLSVRVILLIFCWLKWTFGCQHITLNMHYPEYQLLLNELEQVGNKSVIDNENKIFFEQKKGENLNIIGSQNLLIAIEIEQNWLPPEDTMFLGFLNSNEQRKSILDSLQKTPANRLLIAIDTDRSPDRGIINLIQSLTTKAVEAKIWFINQGRQFDNWQDAISDLMLVCTDPSWLLAGDENA